MAETKTTAKTTKAAAGKTTAQTSAQAAAPTVESTKSTSTSPSPSPSSSSSSGTDSGNVTATPITTASSRAAVAPSGKPPIERGKRLDVTLNVLTVANAFNNALSSRSVRYVQYALHDRGFEPGNDQGKVDFDTRKAYADYQRTIDESPTGVPTAYSLDILGFDVS